MTWKGSAFHVSNTIFFFSFQATGVGIRDATELGLLDLYIGKYWGLKFATQAACTILTVDQVNYLLLRDKVSKYCGLMSLQVVYTVVIR
jgi:hypothetical protein